MDGLNTPHSKLLFAIGELKKEERINDQEKAALKSYVFAEDEKVIDLAEVYEKNEDKEDFYENLIELARTGKTSKGKSNGMNVGTNKSEAGGFNQNYAETIDEVSSPLGTALMEKKRRAKAAKQSLHLTAMKQ
eukprot:CAMPEP_0114981512 /NCGR_PEP_ID=MMETSP0216-20121206/5581_1 /TAXON_ID=223996 /ORGANISM="Protocruzia adherens, Strain Boccale" /LENGTH=132 /DNA_ID=CAMNT_0002343183 /DNA_START=68 /DNA_END=466 /DNA_ORIENTATION=-